MRTRVKRPTSRHPVPFELERSIPFWGEADRSLGPCLLATCATARGYPKLRYNWKFYRLNRLVLGWVLKRELIPEEQALHLCNNRLCIAPRHLKVGDHQMNMQMAKDDGIFKRRIYANGRGRSARCSERMRDE